jgi:two-component system, LytTR family, sensor kinase
MKKTFVLLLHIGFWLCYLILIMVILGVLYGGKEPVAEDKIEKSFETILLFALIPSIISFYAFYSIVFPKFLQRNKIVLATLYSLLFSLIAGIAGYSLLYFTYGGNCVQEEGQYAFVGIILFIDFIAFISGVVALVMRGFITWVKEIKLKEALAQKNHEMELALVKSQLDPHFLFNTINNIDVLILKNSAEASDYLNKLSDIMRFMLYETKSDKIALSKELEYIDKYVQLQKIRTANTNYINYSVNGNPNGKSIAPMIFIPFIENAFKHSTNKKLENAITIKIDIEKERLKFECENKFSTNTKTIGEGNGLGNELIKKRLNLLYPNKHSLEVSTHENLYRVILIIQNG